MSRNSLLRAFALALALSGLAGIRNAQAQDWSNYLHWPYTPPQTPGSGVNYNGLYDGFYVYPREQRIVPQIQGPYYRNFYGGKRILGHRNPTGLFHEFSNKKFYHGYHNVLDVF